MSDRLDMSPAKSFTVKLFARLYKWKLLIVVFGVIGLILGIYIATEDDPSYSAERSFTVNEEESGGFGGSLNSILTQFGMSSGSGGGVNLDRILEIGRSKRISYAILRDSLNGRLIGNRLLELYSFESDRYADYKFDSYQLPSDINDTSLINKVALQLMYRKLIGDGPGSEPLVKFESNDLTGVISLTSSTKSEELTMVLNNLYFLAISDYYISRTVEPQQSTYDFLTSKVDSLRGRINSLERNLYISADTRQGTVSSRYNIEKQAIGREISATTMAYAKAIENQALAEYSLYSQRPFFQTIDEPIMPLDLDEPSLIKSGALGFLLGLLIPIASMILIVGFEIIRELNEPLSGDHRTESFNLNLGTK